MPLPCPWRCTLPDLRVRDVSVLTAAHEFFLTVVRQRVQHDVPLPAGLQSASASEESASTLLQWLDVLDLAISPQMFRDAMANATVETAVALLRFFSQHPGEIANHRDKTDFVVTWLYRHPPTESAWSIEGAFERRLTEIVGDQGSLAEQYRQLLREFRYLEEEAQDAHHFDKLMDSGLIGRVRDIKASFGDSFSHPAVLATVAAYNVNFGKRFDELFKEATREIKAFAQGVQQEGGSPMARVEGDVTVKQLEDIKDQEILQSDYREAQEQFRKVSRFKKAVDSKRKRPAVHVAAPTAEPAVAIRTAAEAKAAAKASASSDLVAEDDRLAFIVPNESTMAAQIEEGKVALLVDNIRSFVKAAAAASAQIVPLKHGNLALAAHEVDAFRVDYEQEKSFRADYANSVMRLVGCRARIDAEMADYQKTQVSAYLWKPHADSLANLIRGSKRLTVEADQIKATAMQRGLTAKAEGIAKSLEKLQERVKLTTETLAQVGGK